MLPERIAHHRFVIDNQDPNIFVLRFCHFSLSPPIYSERGNVTLNASLSKATTPPCASMIRLAYAAWIPGEESFVCRARPLHCASANGTGSSESRSSFSVMVASAG